MKKIFFSLLMISFAFAGMAQTSCSIVSDSFSEEDLSRAAARLHVENDYACMIAERGVHISDMSGKDLSSIPDAASLTPITPGVEHITEQNFNEEEFNILNYAFDLSEKHITQYRIGNSGKVITIISKYRLDAMYN